MPPVGQRGEHLREDTMSTITRREFLRKASANASVVGLAWESAEALRANPLGMPIGCQTWPVRELIAKDFAGTIKMLAKAGFDSIELCSPVGYADHGFAGIGRLTANELRNILRDAGVTCVSSHFSIGELRKDLEGRIAWAKEVGLRQMIVPSLNGPQNPTMDDVKRAADEYNKMGEQTAKAGINQGLHNEDFELTPVDGQRTYDLLFKLFDPKFVNFQFQVSTISQGYNAAEYFTKYPDRFMSMHVQGWSAKTHEIAPVGQDSLDWRNIFLTAKTGGIENYYVEMDLPMMKASVPFLRKLRV